MNTIELQSIVFISMPANATMFLTLDDAKMRIPFPGESEGEHYWSSVQLLLRNVWFLVDYQIDGHEAGHQVCAAILVANAKDVVAICKLANVMQIAMITPEWMNRTDGWKMDTLKEIWTGTEPDSEIADTATICITESGTRHVISALQTAEDELFSLHRIF